MRFSDFAKSKLDEAKDKFGSYLYNDRGPDEVLDVLELLLMFKRLPKTQAESELVHLAQRKDCVLDPRPLVSDILGSVDGDPEYDFLFDNPELTDLY